MNGNRPARSGFLGLGPPADRSDTPGRRRALRELDRPLIAELIAGGATDFAHFDEQVRTRQLLGVDVDSATVLEWWEHARARQLIERNDDGDQPRYAATQRARDELERHKQRELTAPGARRVVGYLVPSGTVGTAIALTERNTAVGVVFATIAALGLIYVLGAQLADYLMTRSWSGQRIDRTLVAFNAKWLDGQDVRHLRKPLPEQASFERLHGVSQRGSTLTPSGQPGAIQASGVARGRPRAEDR